MVQYLGHDADGEYDVFEGYPKCGCCVRDSEQQYVLVWQPLCGAAGTAEIISDFFFQNQIILYMLRKLTGICRG